MFLNLFFIIVNLASSANRSAATVRKSKERGNLSWFLFRFGIDMPSCSSDERAGFRYLADAQRSDRYAKCIKHNKPGCNIFGVSIPTVERMIREEEKFRSKAEVV